MNSGHRYSGLSNRRGDLIIRWRWDFREINPPKKHKKGPKTAQKIKNLLTGPPPLFLEPQSNVFVTRILIIIVIE